MSGWRDQEALEHRLADESRAAGHEHVPGESADGLVGGLRRRSRPRRCSSSGPYRMRNGDRARDRSDERHRRGIRAGARRPGLGSCPRRPRRVAAGIGGRALPRARAPGGGAARRPRPTGRPSPGRRAARGPGAPDRPARQQRGLLGPCAAPLHRPGRARPGLRGDGARRPGAVRSGGPGDDAARPRPDRERRVDRRPHHDGRATPRSRRGSPSTRRGSRTSSTAPASRRWRSSPAGCAPSSMPVRASAARRCRARCGSTRTTLVAGCAQGSVARPRRLHAQRTVQSTHVRRAACTPIRHPAGLEGAQRPPQQYPA